MRFGIDLGTTFSAVSRLGGEGLPLLVPDHADPSECFTPSVVHLSAAGAFVGTVAESMLEQDPELQAIRFFKRNLGDPRPIWYGDGGEPWLAEGVASLVLRKLRHDAEQHTLADFTGAVVTVPAHFTDSQRAAVLAAAALADTPVLGLVEEPVAAALHYTTLSGQPEEVVLVYDFGGGTFDATLMSMDARGVYVLSKTGLTELGGKELDEAVGEMVLAQFQAVVPGGVKLGARTLLDLRRVSEELKIELCLPGRSRARRLVLLGGHAVEVEIARRDFERAIATYVDQTEAELLRCVEEAALRVADVGSVLMVGGSSLVPLVEARLRARFSRPGQRVLFHEPSRSVAYGASLHAAQLAGEASAHGLPPELRGVSGYGVGVRTVGAGDRVVIDPLIKKNMPLPCRVRKTYYTTRPDQVRMLLDFVQYRDEQRPTPLGRLAIGPLASPRVNYPIEVTVEHREDGTIALQAYDAQSGQELEQVFTRGEDRGGASLAQQRALVRSRVVNNVIA